MFEIARKYKSCSVQTRASIWFTICNFAIKGIAFITVPIFTRTLSTEEYGTVTIYTSYQQMLMILATFELSLGAYNKGILKYKERINDYTTSIIWLSSILSGICLCIALILKDLFIELTGTNEMILILTYLMFILFPSYNCWIARKRFEFEYRDAVILTLLYSLLTTIVPLFVIRVKPFGIIKIEVTLIVQILFFLPFYFSDIFQTRITHLDFYIDVFKYTIPYQIPLVFHGLSFLALGQADRIMIGQMVGKTEAAIYSVAYSIGQVISIFQVSINQVFQPFRFKKLENNDFDIVRKSTRVLLIVVSTIIVLFMMIVPEGMKMLFPVDYLEAINLLPPIVASVFFIFLYSIYSDVEAYYDKTTYIMYASAISAVLNIIMNYIGIKLFGYCACAYTTLICYIILSLIHIVLVESVKKKRGITEEIYDNKLSFFLSIIILLFIFLSSVLYSHIILRYVLVLIICGMVLANKRHIGDYWKEYRKL